MSKQFEEIGTIKTVYQNGRYRIDRRVTGHKYPRSGNFHNPTPEYYWNVYQDGKLQGVCGTGKLARSLVSDLMDENA